MTAREERCNMYMISAQPHAEPGDGVHSTSRVHAPETVCTVQAGHRCDRQQETDIVASWLVIESCTTANLMPAAIAVALCN